MADVQREFAGIPFVRVGIICPERDAHGRVVEITIPLTSDTPFHRYGRGPFCQFRIAQEGQWRKGGVYIVAGGDVARYVGGCANLAAIWNQVGRISPSAVQKKGGQQTHCRINTAIFNEISQVREISLWFHPVDDRAKRRVAKTQLTSDLNPPWNLQGGHRPPAIHKKTSDQTGRRCDLLGSVQASPIRTTHIWNEIIAKEREFGGLSFARVGRIQPECNGNGNVVEYMPQSRYENRDNLPLNRYGHGPFCRFSIAKRREWGQAGVYVLAHGDRPLYVGECKDMRRRWGPMGYGHISPRACFKGGQDTNCRINNLILQGVNISLDLDLWFRLIEGDVLDRVSIERELIATLHPPWNR